MSTMKFGSVTKTGDNSKTFPATQRKPLISQPHRAEESMKSVPGNLSALCRLCARKMGAMFPIFDPADSEEKIAKQIRECLPISVEKIGAVSQLICRPCKESLEKLHTFRSNVMQANVQFNRENLLDLESKGDAKEDQNQLSCLNQNKLECSHCADSFADSRGLIEHNSSEINKKWQCQRCPMSFGSICALKRHKNKPHAKIFTCASCGKVFIQKSHLAIHVRKHIEEELLGRDLCDKTSEVQSERKNHMRTNLAERPYKCSLCEKTFINPARRREHMKNHKEAKPFKCTLCEKAFVNSARRREHMKFHKDEKPFKCTLCDKAFKRFSARKIHMTIHTGEKAFKCDVCEKAFKRKADMRKHKKIRHEVTCRTVALRNV